MRWYHGTSKQNAEKILKEGVLKPGEHSVYREDVPRYDAVYLTSDWQIAKYYSEERGKDGVVLEVSANESNLMPDEDSIYDALHEGAVSLGGKANKKLGQAIRNEWFKYWKSIGGTGDTFEEAWEAWGEVEAEGSSGIAEEMKALTEEIHEKNPALSKAIIKASGKAVHIGPAKVVGIAKKADRKTAAHPNDDDRARMERFRAGMRFPLTVYRAIDKNPDDINMEGIGPFWTVDENCAEPHYDGKKLNNPTIVRAQVLEDDIDWEETFYQNMRYAWSEQEVYLKQGKDIKLTGIKQRGGWETPTQQYAIASKTAKKVTVVKTPGFVVEVPQERRQKFFIRPKAPLEYWAFKNRPRVFINEPLIFTFGGKPVAKAVVVKVETPGRGEGEYKDWHKVYWKPSSFRRFKAAKMRLYHGSRTQLKPGTILTPQLGGYVGTPEYDGIEGIMESYRPEGSLSRKNSVYMVADPEEIDYAGGYEDYIYEVEPLGELEKNDLGWYGDVSVYGEYQPNDPNVISAAQSYWKGEPYTTSDSRLWEYRAPKAKIVRLVSKKTAALLKSAKVKLPTFEQVIDKKTDTNNEFNLGTSGYEAGVADVWDDRNLTNMREYYDEVTPKIMALKFPLTVYRCFAMRFAGDKIDYNRLGGSWSLSREAANETVRDMFNSDEYEEYKTITGKITSPDAVDWLDTVRAWMTLPEEQEIRMKSGAKVMVQGKPRMASEVLDPDPNTDPDYYMVEGCGIYAVDFARKNGGEIYILAAERGEEWSEEIPYEVTHAFVKKDGKTFDVRGERTPDKMAWELSMGEYTVKGPWAPDEFEAKFMGDSDERPLYGKSGAAKLPKGWKVTLKKDKDGFYSGHIWRDGQFYQQCGIASEYADKAREAAIDWAWTASGQERPKTAGDRIIDVGDGDEYWAGEGNAASGVLPICPQKGTVCLAWRSQFVMSPGCWGTIGGAVQQGKNPQQSAREELKEEMGYSGGMTLIPAYVFTDRGFSYHNFVGIVSNEFTMAPKPYTQKQIAWLEENDAPDYQFNPGWETDHIVWVPYQDLLEDMKANSGDYHPGVLKLFQNSKDAIERALKITKTAAHNPSCKCEMCRSIPAWKRPWLTGKCHEFALALATKMPDAQFVAIGGGMFEHVGLRKGDTYYDVRGAMTKDQFTELFGSNANSIRDVSREEVLKDSFPSYIGHEDELVETSDLKSALKAVRRVFSKTASEKFSAYYHGTNEDFKEFKSPEGVFYFTTNRRYAEFFADRAIERHGGDENQKIVHEVELDIKKPFDARRFKLKKLSIDQYAAALNVPEETFYEKYEDGTMVGTMRKMPFWRWFRLNEKESKKALQSQGYDGLIQKETSAFYEGYGATSYVVFSPSQIHRTKYAASVMDSRKPCPSGKRKFFDEVSATGPHKQWDPNTPALRAYKCPKCGWFHLTSKPQKFAVQTHMFPSSQDAKFKAWFDGSKVVDKNGNPMPVYHGTRSSVDFEEFSVEGPPYVEDEEQTTSTGSGGDPTAYLGAHFAEEPGVANMFAEGKGWTSTRYEGQAEKPRVVKVYLRITNPKDFGSELNLRNFINQGKITDDDVLQLAMQNDGIIYWEEDEATQNAVADWYSKYENDQNFRVDQNTYLFEYHNREEGDEEVLSHAAYDLARNAKQRLTTAGYDGVRYKNVVEGGTAWIAFDPNQIKSAYAQQFNPKDPRYTASKNAAAHTPEYAQKLIETLKQTVHDADFKVIGSVSTGKESENDLDILVNIHPDAVVEDDQPWVDTSGLVGAMKLMGFDYIDSQDFSPEESAEKSEASGKYLDPAGSGIEKFFNPNTMHTVEFWFTYMPEGMPSTDKTGAALSPKDFKYKLKKDKQQWTLGCYDLAGQVAGSISIEPHENEGYVAISYTYVKPAYRKLGLALEMYRALFQKAKESGLVVKSDDALLPSGIGMWRKLRQEFPNIAEEGVEGENLQFTKAGWVKKAAGFVFKSFNKLWHVGTMNPKDKRDDSYEGAGLSVSVNPEEWQQIAKIGGDLWELTKPSNRFVNFHRLSKAQREQIVDWGIKNGYALPAELWRHSWYDDELEDWRYSDYSSKEEAEGELGSYEEEKVEPVKGGLTATPKLSQKSKRGKIDPIEVVDLLVTAYAEDELDCDGVWWADDLDPDNLSAPRGVIFPSKLKTWKARKAQKAAYDPARAAQFSIKVMNHPTNSSIFEVRAYGDEGWAGTVSVVQKGEDFYVSQSVLPPSTQGIGLGSRLYAWAMDEAENRGGKRFWSDTEVSQDATKIWDRLPSVEFDEKSGRYYTPLGKTANKLASAVQPFYHGTTWAAADKIDKEGLKAHKWQFSPESYVWASILPETGHSYGLSSSDEDDYAVVTFLWDYDKTEPDPEHEGDTDVYRRIPSNVPRSVIKKIEYFDWDGNLVKTTASSKTAAEWKKLPATDEWVAKAKVFLKEKWEQRHKELGREGVPTDLAGACKFASMFAQKLFGGRMVGTAEHQALKLSNGRMLDLTDIYNPNTFKHDKEFWMNPEHEESMKSCEPRVQQWVDEFYHKYWQDYFKTNTAARMETYLYHGTNDIALAGILEKGMPAGSYWGISSVAEYFAKGASEEEGNPVILRIPMNRFDKSKLAVDQVAIAEPLTLALGIDEDTLYEEWEKVPGEGTWEDCLRIYGAVKYMAPMKITKADVWM